MTKKLVFLVLDGAADSPDHRPTPLEAAHKPGLDSLARNCLLGLMYPIAPGIAPESDSAVLSILGYNPDTYYMGRGPLEALGAGVELREGEVAFRANFATVDPKTYRIIDRRVGRSLGTEEARELAEAIDGMRLSGEGYARVVATIGHRAVVIIGSEKTKLSGNVDNTDPAYTRKGKVSVAVENPEPYIRWCRPLEDTPEARETCRLVNEFTRKAIEALDRHPVNLERERRGLPKANAILLRDAGTELPKLPPINEVYGVKFGAIVEMPVEKGIARAAGMRIYEVGYPSGNPEHDLPVRLEATLRALAECDIVYVHLKGPDEPGHDGSFEGKRRAIEYIDKYYVKPLIDRIDLEETAILVTSDHATPWIRRAHSGDPVPVMLSHPKLPQSPGRFDEPTCLKYHGEGLGVIENGWKLLSLVLERLRELG